MQLSILHSSQCMQRHSHWYMESKWPDSIALKIRDIIIYMMVPLECCSLYYVQLSNTQDFFFFGLCYYSFKTQAGIPAETSLLSWPSVHYEGLKCAALEEACFLENRTSGSTHGTRKFSGLLASLSRKCVTASPPPAEASG